MIGSLSALKASRIRPITTARLIAPTTTGLRSRNGVLIAASSEVTPVRAGAVGDREGGLAEPDLAGEVAEVEVEPRAVDRRAADLGELDRQHLQGTVELGLPAVEVGREAPQVVDVGHERRADAGDEVGGLDRQVGDLVERPEDRAAVLLQPSDELLERRDQVIELTVAAAHVVE